MSINTQRKEVKKLLNSIKQNPKIETVINEGKNFTDFFYSLSDMGQAMALSYLSALLDKEAVEKRKEV